MGKRDEGNARFSVDFDDQLVLHLRLEIDLKLRQKERSVSATGATLSTPGRDAAKH
jgi:hypothetical protein